MAGFADYGTLLVVVVGGAVVFLTAGVGAGAWTGLFCFSSSVAAAGVGLATARGGAFLT